MPENNEKSLKKTEDKKRDSINEKKVELTVEQKLKDTEDKLLRSLAEIENQRRRFEKEIKDAFEFGSFNFAKESLAILDNLERAKNAVKNKADYIALGAFNYSKTKKVKYKASINLLKKVRMITKLPIVAIGGINSNNYKKLLLNNANFLAISSYIWNNYKMKPEEAIKKLK